MDLLTKFSDIIFIYVDITFSVALFTPFECRSSGLTRFESSYSSVDKLQQCELTRYLEYSREDAIALK